VSGQKSNSSPWGCELNALTTRLPSQLLSKQVCVQLPTSAVNVAVIAFAAEHRSAALRCGAAAAARPATSIDISCRAALSSKPAVSRVCGRMTGQTDRRTALDLAPRTTRQCQEPQSPRWQMTETLSSANVLQAPCGRALNGVDQRRPPTSSTGTCR